VADIVSVRGTTLVVVDERLVQARLLGHFSGRIDQLHPDSGVGAGAQPIAGRDFGCEPGCSEDRAQHLVGVRGAARE